MTSPVTAAATALATTDGRRTPRHGYGQLLAGAPGNRGGYGPTPEHIRIKLRGSFARRVNVLRKIADNERGEPRDRLAALALMARFGGIEERAVTLISPDVQARIRGTIEAVMGYPGLDETTRAGLLDAIETAWR